MNTRSAELVIAGCKCGAAVDGAKALVPTGPTSGFCTPGTKETFQRASSGQGIVTHYRVVLTDAF